MMVDEVVAEQNGDAQGSSWKGRAVEWLIAAQCVLASGGRLNVSTAMVDDEGVDLVFNRKGTTDHLAIQVKSRFASSSLIQRKGVFRAGVRRKALQPRPDLYLLFALFDDVESMAVTSCWLVPSVEFARQVATQSERRAQFVFATNANGGKGVWSQYRCGLNNLAERILTAIEDCGGVA